MDVSRAATSPPVHDSAVATVQPRARHRSSTSSSTARPSRAKTYGSSAATSAASTASARRGRSRLGDEVDAHLEVVRADRRDEPLPLAARLLEGARDRRLGCAVDANHALVRRRNPGQQLPHRLGRERRAPQPLQLRRRAGQRDRHPLPLLQQHPGRRAREPERERARRQRRLLDDARLEVGVRPPEPLGDRTRHALDLRPQRLVHDKLAAGDAGEQLDRAVVVRRAEAARGDAQVGLEPVPQGRLEVVRVVADDDQPCRLEPQRDELPREERAVAVQSAAPGRARSP